MALGNARVNVNAGEAQLKSTLTKEDKDKLIGFLKEMGLMPPAQGQIIINMSPQGTISAVECRISIR